MRQFARPMAIERLSLEARILYSGFCLFVLVGIGTSLWLYADDKLGVSPSAAEHYYLGGGDAASMSFEKPPRQVMETFHFHAFTVPVVLLVIGHIFMMCNLSTRLKASVLATATLSTLIHLLAPVLTRFATPAAAVLVFPSAALMAVLWIVLSAYPIYAMWRPSPDS